MPLFKINKTRIKGKILELYIAKGLMELSVVLGVV